MSGKAESVNEIATTLMSRLGGFIGPAQRFGFAETLKVMVLSLAVAASPLLTLGLVNWQIAAPAAEIAEPEKRFGFGLGGFLTGIGETLSESNSERRGVIRPKPDAPVEDAQPSYEVYSKRMFFAAFALIYLGLLGASVWGQSRLVLRFWARRAASIGDLKVVPNLALRNTVVAIAVFGLGLLLFNERMVAWVLSDLPLAIREPISVRLAGLGLALAAFLALYAARLRKDRVFNYVPGLIFGVGGLYGFVGGRYFLETVDLPGNLELALASPTYGWIGSAILATVGLLTGTIAIAALGAFATAQRFPSVEETEAFLARNDIPAHTVRNHFDEIWAAMRAAIQIPGAGATPPHVRNTTAAASEGMITAICGVLAILFVATLGVVSSGLDVAQTLYPEADTLGEKLGASAQAWLFVLGAVLTLTLATIYVLPTTRISPIAGCFEDAKAAAEEKTPDEPEKKLVIQGLHSQAVTYSAARGIQRRRASKGVTLVVREASRSQPKEEDTTDRFLEAKFKADKAYISAALSAPKYGGAIHGLLTDKLQPLFIKIATILAPAAVGSILALLS